MKFDALFEMNEPSFFKEAELNEAFIKQVEEMGTDHYDDVISSIISVNTDNEINQSGQSQGAGEPYEYEPLLGLYKTHCIDPSIRSMFMNMQASRLGIKRVESLDEFDIDFTNKHKKTKLKQLNKVQEEGGNIHAFIENDSKQISNELLNNYKTKLANQELTGNWLIFGKSDNKNIFLYLSVSYDHSKENDLKVYQSLINMYSEEFITNLKSGK